MSTKSVASRLRIGRASRTEGGVTAGPPDLASIMVPKDRQEKCQSSAPRNAMKPGFPSRWVIAGGERERQSLMPAGGMRRSCPHARHRRRNSVDSRWHRRSAPDVPARRRERGGGPWWVGRQATACGISSRGNGGRRPHPVADRRLCIGSHQPFGVAPGTT